MTETLSWPYPPTLTNGYDSGQAYSLGTRFTVTVGQPCHGVEWRVPDSTDNPPDAFYNITLWDVATQAILRQTVLLAPYAPVAGGYQQFLFRDGSDAPNPYNLVAGTEYVVTVHTRRYTFSTPDEPPSTWEVFSPSGQMRAFQSHLIPSGSTNLFPVDTYHAWYYVSPIIGASGPSEVTSSLDLRWQVRSEVTGSTDLRWQVRSIVTGSTDLQWAVRNVATGSLDARWAVLVSATSSLDLSWQVRAEALGSVDLRWSSAGSVSSSLDVRWAVKGVATGTLDVRWAVSNQITASLDVRWQTRQRATGSVELRWVVDGEVFVPRSDVRAYLSERVRSRPTLAQIRAYL